MKKLNIIALIAAIFMVILSILCIKINNDENKILKKIHGIYSDNIEIVSINKDFKLSEKNKPFYYIIAKNKTNQIEFTIDQKSFNNTYTQEYWTDWMKKKSNQICFEHFKDEIVCSNIILYSKSLPAYYTEHLMKYNKFMSTCVNDDVSIVFKTSLTYNTGMNTRLMKFLEEIKNSELIFNEITIIFNESNQSLNINKKDIETIVNNKDATSLTVFIVK